MSVEQKMVTAEELWDMPDVPGKRFELVDGEVIEVSPAGDLHMAIVEIVYKRLDRFVEQHNLGLVRFDGLGYVIRRAPDQVRVPDASFVAWDRVPDPRPSARFWEGPPTLAVEVVSPSDRANDIQERVQDYLDAGTRLVWVLWPSRRALTVYDADGGVRQLGPDAALDGGSLLPGFSVRVGDLFEIPRRMQ
jgi:Uma2 family endonuclease